MEAQGVGRGMHEAVDAFLLDRANGYYQLGAKTDGSIHEIEAATMLFAFACELVLKGLGAKAKCHNLRQLFEDLSIERKHWLVTRYHELESRNLLEDISQCADLFRDIRYWHEKKGGAFATGLSRRLARFLTQAGLVAVSERPSKQYIKTGRIQ
ncbi:hypothetical protein [Roseovarius atlanticus]|uniref:hypothetical protein n=1 Tax=Roseovarius atlanticus TaxID=1641875 RepID=UPI001C9669F8|nr:hypothetical protein [Roseovarius atlanticus]MBY5990032.1 hypothetical protein [Roseovarius atlanticus]MBY6126577.1 hypothetical protein [Roseovarius atlanticus]MBY6151071.1 hypothetical protein [Roseovarius atlanticus]